MQLACFQVVQLAQIVQREAPARSVDERLIAVHLHAVEAHAKGLEALGLHLEQVGHHHGVVEGRLSGVPIDTSFLRHTLEHPEVVQGVVIGYSSPSFRRSSQSVEYISENWRVSCPHKARSSWSRAELEGPGVSGPTLGIDGWLAARFARQFEQVHSGHIG